MSFLAENSVDGVSDSPLQCLFAVIVVRLFCIVISQALATTRHLFCIFLVVFLAALVLLTLVASLTENTLVSMFYKSRANCYIPFTGVKDISAARVTSDSSPSSSPSLGFSWALNRLLLGSASAFYSLLLVQSIPYHRDVLLTVIFIDHSSVGTTLPTLSASGAHFRQFFTWCECRGRRLKSSLKSEALLA